MFHFHLNKYVSERHDIGNIEKEFLSLYFHELSQQFKIDLTKVALHVFATFSKMHVIKMIEDKELIIDNIIFYLDEFRLFYNFLVKENYMKHLVYDVTDKDYAVLDNKLLKDLYKYKQTILIRKVRKEKYNNVVLFFENVIDKVKDEIQASKDGQQILDKGLLSLLHIKNELLTNEIEQKMIIHLKLFISQVTGKHYLIDEVNLHYNHLKSKIEG